TLFQRWARHEGGDRALASASRDCSGSHRAGSARAERSGCGICRQYAGCRLPPTPRRSLLPPEMERRALGHPQTRAAGRTRYVAPETGLPGAIQHLGLEPPHLQPCTAYLSADALPALRALRTRRLSGAHLLPRETRRRSEERRV